MIKYGTLPEKFLEKDIENILCEENSGKLWVKGLSRFRHDEIKRQLHLGKAGRTDIIGVTYLPRDVVTVTVYEVKKGPINEASVDQIQRYISELKQVYSKDSRSVCISGVLIGNSLNRNGIFALKFVSDDIDVYKYHNDDMGFYFEQLRIAA